MYNTHFLLNKKTAGNYVREKLDNFTDQDSLITEELSDGNINYVFRVYDKNTGKSVVVKQADKLLRSSGRPLDLYRNKIEAEILKIQSRLAPLYIPKVYYYDDVMCALIMEDISDYKNLRLELMNGKIFPNLALNISDFMVNTLLPLTDLVMDRHEKKKYVQFFTNIELCDISEDLVFTEPYWNYKSRNIITPGNETFVERELYNDKVLHAEVAYLRDRFMNCAQSLIHGDLHTGSIFINENGLKVIDPEFAFYGPIGYDIGNVIGNLFISLIYLKHITKNDSPWLMESINDVYCLTYQKMEIKYDELVSMPLYKNIKFKRNYIREIMADALGYAGTEIIRRTVGDSKVIELITIEDNKEHAAIDQILINLGKRLILDRYSYSDKLIDSKTGYKSILLGLLDN